MNLATRLEITTMSNPIFSRPPKDVIVAVNPGQEPMIYSPVESAEVSAFAAKILRYWRERGDRSNSNG